MRCPVGGLQSARSRLILQCLVKELRRKQFSENRVHARMPTQNPVQELVTSSVSTVTRAHEEEEESATPISEVL